jgi:hypothetical protein
MNKVHEQQEKEWKHRVDESKRVQNSQKIPTSGQLFFFGFISTAGGIYGVARDWIKVSGSHPNEVIGRNARGLNITLGDHLSLCAGFTVVGLVALWVGIRKLRKHKKDDDDKTFC